MQLYVQAKSKKALNDKLASGQIVYGTSYTLFQEELYRLDGELPSGTVIKVYDKFVGGSPYAKAYGTWDNVKHCVK